MSTVLEIQQAIGKLTRSEKEALSAWLQSQEEPILSAREETVLLASLDQAARELDAGQGAEIESVREMVAKWATK